MVAQLDGKRVAILVADGFEQVELTSPREALEEAGAEPVIVSPEDGTVRGWDHTDWGDDFDVELPLEDADPAEFDALHLPGGVMNPDNMRRSESVQRFVRAFFEAGKPVGVICHGAWTLIDAGLVEGRRLTSYHSIQADLKNAGAYWVDEEVVVDKGLVSSRNPDDLPAFERKLVEEIGEGVHEEQRERTPAVAE
ncbi:MAG: type 1 glutamine amidotransferase domain-containing protein [Gemmatimonadota bacterium]|nr:type 1 glutamine amidotransferase domain-containing protein [Gemmatimonadota bacterium]